MNETAILVWAAGGSQPDSPSYAEDYLLEATRQHHLSVRLKDRLTAARPAWASPGLLAGVRDLAEDAYRRTGQLRAAYHEVVRSATGATAPVLVKGIAYPLLLEAERAVTWSADLDLFAAETDGLLRALTSLGYLVDPKDPPEPFGRKVRHEYAKLNRAELQVDLHRSFPAWGYPAAAAARTAVDPRHRPGSWRCVSSLNPGKIATGSVLAETVQRPGSGPDALPITSAEMTALISCCHIFANYVTEFPKPHATVRLGELANLVDLLAQPWFDWPRFHRLAETSTAHDAVAYAFALIDHYLGRRYEPPAGALFPGTTVPPRSLWFARGEDVFLVATDGVESPDNAVIRSTGTDTLVTYLGPNQVLASRPGPRPEWYGTPGAGPATTLARVLTQDGGDPLPVRLAVTWDDDHLVLHVSDPVAGPGMELNLLLYFDTRIFECIEHPDGALFVYDRASETRIIDGQVRFDRRHDGYRIHLPWSLLSNRLIAPEALPLLFGARLWAGTGERPAASTLLPLRLRREP